jgi:hypothetical protein
MPEGSLFARDVHKVPLFFKLWFAFIAVMMVAVFAFVAWAIIGAVIMGPEAVGQLIGSVGGSVVRGFNTGIHTP